jgi:hypothetical protein
MRARDVYGLADDHGKVLATGVICASLVGMWIGVFKRLKVLQQLLDTESLGVALQRPGPSLVERSEVAPENVFPEFASGVLEQAVNASVELTVQDALEAAASGVQLFC